MFKKWLCKSFCDTSKRDRLTHIGQFYWQIEGCPAITTIPELVEAIETVVKASEEKGPALLQRFIQQSDQNNLDERKAVWKVLDISQTEASSTDDLITELAFTADFSGFCKNTAAGLDKVKYLSIKNLSEMKRALHTVRRKLRNRTGK